VSTAHFNGSLKTNPNVNNYYVVSEEASLKPETDPVPET
jgi:hypothetical protein